MNVKPELIIVFLIGVFVGSFLYRLWRRHSLRKAVDRCGADVAEAGRLVRQMPPRESPPAPVPRVHLPPPDWREMRPTNPPKLGAEWYSAESVRRIVLGERERCAQLADSMDCAWRCRVGQEVGAAIRRQGRGPGQPDPNPRGGSC